MCGGRNEPVCRVLFAASFKRFWCGVNECASCRCFLCRFVCCFMLCVRVGAWSLAHCDCGGCALLCLLADDVLSAVHRHSHPFVSVPSPPPPPPPPLPCMCHHARCLRDSLAVWMCFGCDSWLQFNSLTGTLSHTHTHTLLVSVGVPRVAVVLLDHILMWRGRDILVMCSRRCLFILCSAPRQTPLLSLFPFLSHCGEWNRSTSCLSFIFLLSGWLLCVSLESTASFADTCAVPCWIDCGRVECVSR